MENDLALAAARLEATGLDVRAARALRYPTLRVACASNRATTECIIDELGSAVLDPQCVQVLVEQELHTLRRSISLNASRQQRR